MRNTDLFDKHLNNSLNAEEKADFENRLHSDEIFAKAFHQHEELIGAIKAHNQTEKLKASLKEIHSKEFGGSAKVISINKEETFAKRYGKTVMVAASTALIAVLSTVAALSTGGWLLAKQNEELTGLRKEVDGIKISQGAIVEGIKQGAENSKKKVVYAPANFEGSAFALNNNGYIVTSLHMISGADSVFIQNATTDRTLAKVVLTDSKLDLAVLKIEDKELIKKWQVPFAFSNRSTDVGEKIFTLGYPRKEMVYGEGSLSSLSGYNNDTTMYQISIPVNPGNSGGPLLDEQGNIIGIVRGKINTAEATGFAVKSQEIVKAISFLSSDTIAIPNKKIMPKGLKRTEQIKRINPYVFNVLVY